MKKSTKIIIAVVSVIAVAAIVFAILYFATDLFKTRNPKKAFYEYLDKAAASESEFNYSDMIASLKDVQNKSYEGKGKMSMDIELGSTMKNQEYEQIIDLLNNAEISYETKADPKNSNTYTAMNIKYNGKDLGKFELLVNEDELGIKLAEMYDKYLTITFEEMLEELDIDSSSIDMSSLSMDDADVNEIVELLEISDDEITRIKDRYKKVLEDTIPEDNYSSEKEKITVNGKEINATAYSVEVSEKDLAKLVKAMVESLADDDDTLDLIIEKANKIMDLAGESTTISKRQLTSALSSVAASLEDTDELSDMKLKVSVYEYKDKTVRIKFAMNEDAITIDSLEDGDTTNMALKVKAEGTEMTIMNIEQTKKGDGKYSTKLSTDLQGMKLEITLDTESTDSNAKENMKLYVEIPSMIKATLNVETEAEYKSVSIDKLSSNNSVAISSLNNLTQTQQVELMKGLLNYIDNHMEAIKEIATKLGYEDEIEEFEGQLETLKSQSSQTSTTPDEDTDSNDEDAA